MPTVWLSLRRSLHCKSEPSDVHDPKARRQLSTILTKKPCRSGCSRSIANLKDVIHGMILSNSRCELKITGFGGFQEGGGGGGGGGVGTGGGSTFVGTLRPGTPGPGGHPTMHYFKSPSTPPRKSPFLLSDREGSGFGGSTIFGGGSGAIHSNNRASLDTDSNGTSAVTCHKCGEQFSKWEAVETHHLSKHAAAHHLFSVVVTELVEGDSSRKIVEIICRTSWLKSENHCGRIERVLKVHNMQKTLGRFEEYREMVKTKASKLPRNIHAA
ncbi:hypothetical protein CK203_029853 [Vitis vinifera]|uniref:C2H2-type domain-containing protein n=1 Tax=Vitis vinifera TaxID=29760 RepID=A0A438IDG2_VITVI|nr:hypothetical protein CK203_029853 [Vitis vinifera]